MCARRRAQLSWRRGLLRYAEESTIVPALGRASYHAGFCGGAAGTRSVRCVASSASPRQLQHRRAPRIVSFVRLPATISRRDIHVCVLRHFHQLPLLP